MSEKKKQNLKEYQQIIVRLKNQNKKVLTLFLHSIKTGTKSSDFR